MMRWIHERTLRSRSRIRGAVRGAVMVEYALLLVAVGIPTVAGLTAGGVKMLDQYQTARDAMLAPFP